jgi:hypothetical protein
LSSSLGAKRQIVHNIEKDIVDTIVEDMMFNLEDQDDNDADHDADEEPASAVRLRLMLYFFDVVQQQQRRKSKHYRCLSVLNRRMTLQFILI